MERNFKWCWYNKDRIPNRKDTAGKFKLELIVDANIVHITTDDTTAWTPTAMKIRRWHNC